jgi:uncharacterized OsmC-like protein
VKIILAAEDRIRLEPVAGPMTIEAERADAQFSPFHMVAAGLATCVFSVLASWAGHSATEVDDLAVEVSWTFADRPHRVAGYRLELHWPSLPPARRDGALRAAALCPIHRTLEGRTAVEAAIAG